MYSEFHFNSEGRQRNPQSSRDRPSYDLGEPIAPKKIQLKSLSLPLTFCNAGGSGSFTITLSGNAHVYNFKLDDICAIGNEFALALHTAMSNAVWVTNPNGEPVLNFSGLSLTLSDTGYLVYLITNDFAPGWTGFSLLWSEELSRLMNRPYESINTPLVIPKNVQTNSLSQLKLVPTHVYFNSNMMQGTPYGSSTRPIGGFASRTIMAKININPTYAFGNTSMPWTNGFSDPAFMFHSKGELQSLEFWFTDEDDRVLKFENAGFSFTIAMML